MPAKKRFKTKYAGVTYHEVEGPQGKEKVYYIRYRRDGKLIEEKAGWQFRNDMTAAKASGIRTDRIQGKDVSNADKRAAAVAEKEAEKGKWTVRRLWQSYLENKPGLKSKAADSSRFKRYIEPAFGGKEPHEILPLDIDRLLRKNLKGASESGQTQKHVLALLRRLVNYGMKKRLCAGLTFALETPSVDNTITENLSSDQLSALLKALDESNDIQASHIMLMALYTGMRKGEILKLQWSDIDFDRGFIRIRNPKGKKSETIPLNSAARQILENHPSKGGYVFVSQSGGPFSEIRKRIAPIVKAANLPAGFRPLHGLRHVYASILASSGQVDMYTLQKLLTHKSSAMTQRYAHLRDEALRRASDLAGEILADVKKTSGGQK
jgi:integrase